MWWGYSKTKISSLFCSSVLSFLSLDNRRGKVISGNKWCELCVPVSLGCFRKKKFTNFQLFSENIPWSSSRPSPTFRAKNFWGKIFTLSVDWTVEVGNKRWKLATFLYALKCLENSANRIESREDSKRHSVAESAKNVFFVWPGVFFSGLRLRECFSFYYTSKEYERGVLRFSPIK